MTIPGSYSFSQGDAGSIDLVEALWNLQRDFHVQIGSSFQSKCESVDFERRKSSLLGRSQGGALLVDRVHHKDEPVGYCISSVDSEGNGEIDSLYVVEHHRRAGLGTNLVRRSINWLDSHQATQIVMAVFAENLEALEFYQQLGISPRTILLERPLDA